MNCSFAINNLAQLYGFFPSEIHRVTAVKRFADVKKLKIQTAANGVKVTPQYRLAAKPAVQVTPVTNYKHFRNVPPMKPPFTPRLDSSNQYTTFG